MNLKSGKQVKSLWFRKLTFGIFFLVLIPFSAFFHYPVIRGGTRTVANIAGMVIIFITALFAIYTHSLFPPRHKRPEDFGHLLTSGPYRYVRHPFYSAFIIMGFGIALYFASVPGIIFNILLIFMWQRLAKLEEKELLEYCGDKYKQFMETRPRFFPRPVRRHSNS